MIRCLAILGLSLAIAPATAEEIVGDPVDTSFHLDDASLPDPVRSPGGTSPGLTAEDLCTTPTEEFSSTPPVALCDEMFAEHAISPDHRFQYRCGFLVPPTIGGSGAPTNVWLQPVNEAGLKQAADKEARKRVCAQTMALAEAQKLLAGDWVGAYRKFFRANDKLLPIAKVERAPASFDAPPGPIPPGASPRAYLDNGGIGGGYGDGGPYAGGGSAGDLGGGTPDDRRRRHRPLQYGDRDANRGSPNAFDPRAADERGRKRPNDVRAGTIRPGAVRLGDVRPTDVRPNDVRPNDVRPTNVRPTGTRPNDLRPNDIRSSRSDRDDARPAARDGRFDGRSDPMASRDHWRQPHSGLADDRRWPEQRRDFGGAGSPSGDRDDPGRSARPWPARPGPGSPGGFEPARGTLRPSPAYPSAGMRGPQRGAMLRRPGGRGMMRGRHR